MMEVQQLKKILEGALLAAGKPLPLERLESLFGEGECPERELFEEALKEIGEDCGDRGFELKKVASGYRFQVRQELSEWVGRLWEEKPQRYSRALMETLSIIAYRQPITRGDIEKIRGVAVSTNIVQTLLEHEWVRVVGHRDVPGRPAMYATTKQFLDYFNLESLEELPPLSEIRDLEEINRELSLDSEEKPSGRIIEFPDPEENSDEVEVDVEAESAAAIGTRPISEILSEVDSKLGIAPELEEMEEAASGSESGERGGENKVEGKAEYGSEDGSEDSKEAGGRPGEEETPVEDPDRDSEDVPIEEPPEEEDDEPIEEPPEPDQDNEPIEEPPEDDPASRPD